MQSREEIISQFFKDGSDFATKVTDEYITEQKMFQLLEHEILKILNLNSKENGNFIKLSLLSNILERTQLESLEFSVVFDPTYLDHYSEKFHISLIKENFKDINNLDNPNSVITYRDLKILELKEYEQSFFNKNFTEKEISKFQQKSHILCDEDDIYIEEVPLYDGRFSHIFKQRNIIILLLKTLMTYIKNHNDLLTLTAMILFEIENLSSTKTPRNYFYNDITDRVNPNNQWFSCLDINLEFIKPLINIVEPSNIEENALFDTSTFTKIS